MDVGKLLQKIIAQNEMIIRQNEKLLLLLAARANKKDAELLAELKKINQRQDCGTATTSCPRGSIRATLGPS
jgi:hypothetical protein